MEPSTTPITGKYNEDPMKHAYLGKPLFLEHHARHPRPHDPLKEHLHDYMDMVNDHHYDVLNCAKYGLSGAFFAGVYGVTFGAMFKRHNSLAFRKLSHYVKENTFGRVEYRIYPIFL